MLALSHTILVELYAKVLHHQNFDSQIDSLRRLSLRLVRLDSNRLTSECTAFFAARDDRKVDWHAFAAPFRFARNWVGDFGKVEAAILS